MSVTMDDSIKRWPAKRIEPLSAIDGVDGPANGIALAKVGS